MICEICNIKNTKFLINLNIKAKNEEFKIFNRSINKKNKNIYIWPQKSFLI